MRLMAVARLVAGGVDREHVGGAERGPDLFAVIAGDGGEHAGTLRRHPHVVAAQLGVGRGCSVSAGAAVPPPSCRSALLRRWRRSARSWKALGLTVGYHQAVCYAGLRRITTAYN